MSMTALQVDYIFYSSKISHFNLILLVIDFYEFNRFIWVQLKSSLDFDEFNKKVQ